MKLSWIDILVLFGLLVVTAVALYFLFPKTVETDAKSGKQVIKANFLTIKKAA